MTPIFTRKTQCALLWILSHHVVFPYGTLTLFGPSFQKSSGQQRQLNDSPNTTSPITFLWRIQFALHRFRSLLLTASLLISLPADTKTFQFSAFPYTQVHQSEVTFGNSWFNVYVRLPKTFRSLSRPSSASEPSHPPCSLSKIYSSGIYDGLMNMILNTQRFMSLPNIFFLKRKMSHWFFQITFDKCLNVNE